MKPFLSIDIFDTAIFRDVINPTDVFSVVENNIGNNFKSIRIEAQRRCMSSNLYCSLMDIYNNMPKKFNPREEILAEIEGCSANPYILDIYNSNKYDCIFISDMYLPSEVLIKMLEKCGYKSPSVFVSCEEKAHKGSGELFLKVQKKLGRTIDKHIGDNYSADIEGAKKAGIKEVEFIGPAIYNKKINYPELQEPRLRKLIIEKEADKEDIEVKIGYLFGSLIHAFVSKLLKEAEDNQTIFFNARDSFILYIVARWLFKTKKKIKYCRFSRKSAYIPNLSTELPLSHEKNSRIFHFLKYQRIKTLRGFLKEYNLDENKGYSYILDELGVTLDTPIDYFSKRIEIVEKFLLAIQDELYKKVSEYRKNFITYIKNLGMKEKDIFVDLGYSGSMQANIKDITGINLIGKYIQTISLVSARNDIIKESFLPNNFLGIYAGVVEIVLSEPRGTVTHYNGNGVPICNSDLKNRKCITKKLLKGIIEGVKDVEEKGLKVYYNDCLIILNKFLKEPTVEQALFGNQKIFENGSSENFESPTNYNVNLIRAGKVKECYNKSYWKSAFKLLLKNDPDLSFLENKIK